MANESGITPVEYKVLILSDQVATKSEGGLHIPQESIDRDQLAQTEGQLIEVSDMAFSGWECRTPKVGERIKFARYAGLMVDGDDGKQYRIINDKDIVAILGAKR